MSTIALTPAEAIRALSGELYDALRELLDTTPRDDPSLLEKTRAMVQGRGSIGSRITRVRNRIARAADPKQAENGKRTASTPPTQKTPAGAPPAPKPAASEQANSTPKSVLPTRTTVTIPRTTPPHSPRPSTTTTALKPAARTPAAVPNRGGGRHRASTPRHTPPSWLLPVLLVAAVVGALAPLTGIGWSIAAGVLAGVVLFARTRPHLTKTIRLKIKRGGTPHEATH